MKNRTLCRRLLWVLAAVLLLLPTAALADNLLENAGFEALGSNGLPLGWSTSAYYSTEGYTVFSAGESGADGHCAVITNFGANDARFEQTVTVEPNSLYRLSGYINVSDVEEEGWGANLSVAGVYITVDSRYETNGAWQYTEIYGETDTDQTSLTVYVRLGGYGGESIGTARFDSICLEKVDRLPVGVSADPWYFSTLPYDDDLWLDDDETDSAAAKPAWPSLLIVSAVWLAAVLLVIIQMRAKETAPSASRRMPWWLWAGLCCALLVRIVIAVRVPGYGVDIGCFSAWGYRMASVGPGQFYAPDYFCDYPPAYMLVLGLTYQVYTFIASLFGGAAPSVLSLTVLIKLPPMICDVAMAWLCWHTAKKHGATRLQSGLISLLFAFCPAMIMNSAAWGQVDAVLCLLLALVVLFAIEHKWMAALPIYMLAVLTKPQALMAGPLGLIALGIEFFTSMPDGRGGFRFGIPWKRTKGIVIGMGLMQVVAAAIILPFAIGSGGLGWLFEKYAATLNSYAYATVNTANLYYLFGGNWSMLEHTAHWGTALVLAIVSIGWGAWLLLRMCRLGCRLPWLEPSVMTMFAVGFGTCGILRVSWTVLGTLAMVMAFAVVIPLFIRSGRLELLPLVGAMLFLFLYAFGIKMHERYLFPALILLGMAAFIHRDHRITVLLAVLSVTLFLNEGIILDNDLRLGSTMGHLNLDTYALNMTVSAVNVLCCLFGLWITGDLALRGKAAEAADAPEASLEKTEKKLPLFDRLLHRIPEKEPSGINSYVPDSSLRWTGLDTLLMLGVTAIYAVVALCNLGSTHAPQSFWTSSADRESIVLDLGDDYEDAAVAYYCAVSYSDFTIAVSRDGETWTEYHAQMNEGMCYQWHYLMPTYQSGGSYAYAGGYTLQDIQRLDGRYVRITANQIGLQLGEVIFRDADGMQIIPTLVEQTGANLQSPNYSDAALIIDEPDALEGEPGWYNSTYFDEIYHARTAKELLDGQNAYEWTHPHLGKELMALGVSIFGMTPFGWRFMGALMGILMLPFMYLLAKQLTKKTLPAFAAICLMALDCMHLTQTRLATVDSYVVFFILASTYFMVRFMQHDLVLCKMRQLLPSLGLSGLMAACAIASKWTGLYAGVGLALMYFWMMARHLRLRREARMRLKYGTGVTKAERAVLEQRVRKTWPRLIFLCLWCLLFFVLVPAAVYLLSYIPHFVSKNVTGFGNYIQQLVQLQQSMLSYHGTPGLGMDHSFYTPWYEWPFNIKPMYYAMGYYQPEGFNASIWCFGNPIVWTVGLVGVAAMALLWCRQHVYRSSGLPLHTRSSGWSLAPAVILIGLAAQFMPWVLVPRGTYIYHYFASIPFLIIATVLVLHLLRERFRRIGLITTAVLLVLALVSFIGFYPYASGVTAPRWWLDFMENFLHIYYIG